MSLDQIAVEIGDSKQADFFPQVKLARWSNEVNFSARLVGVDAKTSPEVRDGKVYLRTGDLEAALYEKPIENGYELEAILHAPPATNVIEFTLETKGLDFWYQPALTESEIANGGERPENVIGSYAVYHSLKKGDYSALGGNNYQTGKFGHIYRPEAVDAAGNRTWCELNVDVAAGLLSITVPQKFLDTATYPVVVDPTFGYTTQGGTNLDFNGVDQGMAYGPEPLSVAATVSKITLASQTNSGSGNVKALIYAADGTAGRPGTKKIVSSVVAVGSSVAFRDFTASGSLGAADYMLGFVGGSGTVHKIRYDTVGGYTGYTVVNLNYATPTTPFPASSDVGSSRYSIYVTYTEDSIFPPVPSKLMAMRSLIAQ